MVYNPTRREYNKYLLLTDGSVLTNDNESDNDNQDEFLDDSNNVETGPQDLPKKNKQHIEKCCSRSSENGFVGRRRRVDETVKKIKSFHNYKRWEEGHDVENGNNPYCPPRARVTVIDTTSPARRP